MRSTGRPSADAAVQYGSMLDEGSTRRHPRASDHPPCARPFTAIHPAATYPPTRLPDHPRTWLPADGDIEEHYGVVAAAALHARHFGRWLHHAQRAHNSFEKSQIAERCVAGCPRLCLDGPYRWRIELEPANVNARDRPLALRRWVPDVGFVGSTVLRCGSVPRRRTFHPQLK